LSGHRRASRPAHWLARGAVFKALRHPGNDGLSPGISDFRSSQSEPLCLCRHRPEENCSRTAKPVLEAVREKLPAACNLVTMEFA